MSLVAGRRIGLSVLESKPSRIWGVLNSGITFDIGVSRSKRPLSTHCNAEMDVNSYSKRFKISQSILDTSIS